MVVRNEARRGNCATLAPNALFSYVPSNVFLFSYSESYSSKCKSFAAAPREETLRTQSGITDVQFSRNGECIAAPLPATSTEQATDAAPLLQVHLTASDIYSVSAKISKLDCSDDEQWLVLIDALNFNSDRLVA
jgi:hypothetical protein